MRLIVFGSRDYQSRQAVEDELALFVASGYRTIVHGACPTGADRYARDWVKGYVSPRPMMTPVVEDPFPADWERLGKRAGPIRNQAMVDAGAMYALGFWDGVIHENRGNGTKDMLGRVLRASIRCSMQPDTLQIVGSSMLDTRSSVAERIAKARVLLTQGYRVYV